MVLGGPRKMMLPEGRRVEREVFGGLQIGNVRRMSETGFGRWKMSLGD